jgi:mannose-1-phosphate guanylyltransferase
VADFHAVIPAGGAGTRLWPLSRASRPKFLLDLTGNGRSLIQQTWDRLSALAGAGNIHVVSGAAHAPRIREQLPELQHVYVEPAPRDSMPAIGLAAAIINHRDPDTIIGSFAADQTIADDDAFVGAVREAITAANDGLVCTLGITPRSPSTAFGYIEAGQPLSETGTAQSKARLITRFVEKPDATTAEAYVASGSYFWNAGMFVTRTDVLLGHLERLHPTLHEGLVSIARAWDTADRDDVLNRIWPDLQKIAIDHAVAEPVSLEGGMAVVPGTFGWDDIGDFAAVHEFGESTDALWVDANGLAIADDDTLIAVIGIPDAVVIRTDDAILVTTLAHAQRVKEIPTQLKALGRDELV